MVELRDLPDFTRDWQKLSAWCEFELGRIPVRVAGTTALNRDDVIAKIMSALSSSRFVAVVGASGTGKSVVAKAVAQEFREGGNVLWFKGERLRPGYVETLASHYQLNHPLQEVMSNGKREGGLIVLDSGERLLDEADFAEMSLLLNMLAMDKEGCGWRLLVTCREEAWERVQHGLGRAFAHLMSWCPVRVDYPSFEMLAPVWDAFPELRTLAVRPHLSQVMRNLKVLDLLASAVSAGQNPDARSWVGESQMIAWYWQYVVREGSKGAQRDVLLQKLAILNADRGRFETLEAELSADDLAIIGESSHLLSTDADRGTISFTHDLIADWARLRALIAHERDFTSFCEHRFTNPHWHAALRLYGVTLLEKDVTGEQWKEAILDHPKGQDFFLESLVFAGNSRELLGNVWPILVADKGTLLNAFLKRFQYVASIPNLEYIALAIQIGSEAKDEARTWARIPLWMYWLGVLPALAAHTEDLFEFAPTETARLARTWLRHTPRDWRPGRRHAAVLAVGVAQQALRTGSYSHHSDENARLPYTALLEAYPDQPDTVRELLLKAAARIEPTKEDGKLFEHYEAPGTVTHVNSFIPGGKRIAQSPWPDGPLYRVDDAFRGACFETDALHGIMVDVPDLAREIILALLIARRPPKTESDYHTRESMFPEDEVCLEHDHSFYPRFYTKGPFLLFLRVNPNAALLTIIRLIDFATKRWMESRYREEDRQTGLDIPLVGGDKHFIGDADVFHWYHGVLHSDIASSALMAVEKWLYECREKKEPVDRWVDLILESSQSMAFLGMLCEIGRYAPVLFAGPLRPLLLIPDTYYEETFYALKGRMGFGTPTPIREGEWFFNLAREWDSMEHRKRRLIDIAVYLFYHHEDTREALLSARERWSSASKQGDERWRRHTEALIATFDEENWKEVELPDGSRKLVFEEPEHLKTSPDQLAQSEKKMLLLTMPMTCRRMIDEGKRLNEEEIPAFVQRSRDLIGFEPEDKDAVRTSAVADSLLGTVAVLFLLHRDWLQNNPDEEKWCVEVLDQILAEPPPWPEFDRPESIGNHDWEHFACEVAPIIWAEDPGNRVARERIVRLALAKHYSAAGVLLFRAFERRESL